VPHDPPCAPPRGNDRHILGTVMRNLSDTADREFNSTVVKVSPEETEFAVDIQISYNCGN